MKARVRGALVVLASFGLATPTASQEPVARPRPVAAPEDVETIDAIVSASYDVISGAAGVARDWNRELSLFHPESRHIPTRKSESGEWVADVMTVDEFIELAGPYFEREGFFEHEIARTTERFGNIAHVFSTYEWSNEKDGPARGRGINSFQLLFDGSRWWIMSVFWQQESEEYPIPVRYAGSPVPPTSRQLILVLAESFDATTGTLSRFERTPAGTSWAAVGEPAPIALGRNGLGLGAGLDDIDPGSMPVKREGDGKSPAGVFRLSSAFGYASASEIGSLNIPYTPVTDRLECVDDVESEHYNRIIDRDAVAVVDWQSSEQMLMPGIWYEKGIVVEHNSNPVRPGAGSCIFLHNWAGPEDTTAGCTSMAPATMSEIVRWIDSSADPILVQLTERLYREYRRLWGLPDPIATES